MPLTHEERTKIRDTELLKKEIRDELKSSESKSRVAGFFAHSAVLLVLGFILTTGVGSWLTYFWKQRDWANQQSYLARQRALDKKYAVIDRTFKEVAVTITASQDVLATYFWDPWTDKEIQERRANWLKTSRDWRIASNVLSQNIAISFSNPEIQTAFKGVVDKRTVLGNGISRLPIAQALKPGTKQSEQPPEVTRKAKELLDLSNAILDQLQVCGRLMSAETKTLSVQ
jgi:hypothetical protein